MCQLCSGCWGCSSDKKQPGPQWDSDTSGRRSSKGRGKMIHHVVSGGDRPNRAKGRRFMAGPPKCEQTAEPGSCEAEVCAGAGESRCGQGSRVKRPVCLGQKD